MVESSQHDGVNNKLVYVRGYTEHHLRGMSVSLNDKVNDGEYIMKWIEGRKSLRDYFLGGPSYVFVGDLKDEEEIPPFTISAFSALQSGFVADYSDLIGENGILQIEDQNEAAEKFDKCLKISQGIGIEMGNLAASLKVMRDLGEDDKLEESGYSWSGYPTTYSYSREQINGWINEHREKLNHLRIDYAESIADSCADLAERIIFEVGPFMSVEGMYFPTGDFYSRNEDGITSISQLDFPKVKKGKLIFSLEGRFKARFFGCDFALEKITEYEDAFCVEAAKKLVQKYGSE